jgi:putative hydrolase of the HAD superfamily
MPLRALYFDLDDTLVDRASAGERYFADWVRRRPDAFGADVIAAVRALVALDWEHSADRPGYCRAVAEAYPALGEPAAIWADFCEHLPRFMEGRPAVERLLAALVPHYRLGLITNGPGSLQRAKLAASGYAPHFDGIFVSGEVGYDKPDPRIFDRALEAFGCAAADAMMIGDAPAYDLLGARRVGMATVWVGGLWRRRGRPYPAHVPAPDYVIDAVEDLVTLAPFGALAANPGVNR